MGTEAIQRMGTGKKNGVVLEEKPPKSCDFMNISPPCCSILHQLSASISIHNL
jgi:hypothetical protein